MDGSIQSKNKISFFDDILVGMSFGDKKIITINMKNVECVVFENDDKQTFHFISGKTVTLFTKTIKTQEQIIKYRKTLNF